MKETRFTYPEDDATRLAARAWAETVKNGFIEPRRRERPRSAIEAAWLARNGTAARLIGPIS